MRTLLTIVFMLAFTPNAFALGPDEQAIYLEISGDIALRPDLQPGLGLGVSYARGLTDTLAIRATANETWLEKKATRGIFTTKATLGATLALDALAYIPYLDLAILGADFRDQTSSSQWLGTRLELGMDHLLSRHSGIGLGLRSDFFLIRLAGAPMGTMPIQLSLALRYARYF
jgi:hypothetical protein